ncbi:MAG: FAD-dependent oxidoreductase [Gammaproteobacteria bacterium]|nr:FAD-dependent oxidoreductase [Gammaproteobacteria bacterium]
MSPPFSRRQFLNMVGAAGGSAAVYQTSVALGLIPDSAAAHTPRAELQTQRGTGPSVVILGAGISGLVCAYELERAGYDVTVIEASGRIGGRNMTVRRGDTIDEMGNRQVCGFDDDPNLYFNCGPARIPAHHEHLLHYCKTLGVPLEMFINVNYHAWVHDPQCFDGAPVRMREYFADARGFMTELISKAVNKAEFEAAFTDHDAERLLAFLRAYGDLDENNLYKGSRRAGYASGGMTSPPELKTPLDFSDILKSNFWRFRMHWGEGEDQAAPLMQAVGGNDNIVRGFVRNISSPIITSAPVQSIKLLEDGVEVAYDHRGRIHTLRADYCFNCIPMHLLPGIPNNLPADYRAAMSNGGRGKLTKIGLQMNERFWEKEHIYGGISWTDQEVEQIWYPSHGIHGDKGIMLGAYIFNEQTNEAIARLTPAERIELAIRNGEKIHPNYRAHVENGVTVAWHRHELHDGLHHAMGIGTDPPRLLPHSAAAGRPALPDRRSDELTPGWQEGAISSAHLAMAEMDRRVREAAQNA